MIFVTTPRGKQRYVQKNLNFKMDKLQNEIINKPYFSV